MLDSLHDAEEMVSLTVLDGLAQSRADLKAAALLLGRDEIRYLVDTYYQVQDFRKAAANMRRSLETDGQPANFVGWLSDSQQKIENDIKLMLYVWCSNDPVASWLMGIHGVAEVIAAGMLAHIDIEKAPTAGHIWNFAGLNPSVKWGKKEKRPWNARLKRLCWIAGDCIVKSSNSPKSQYGPIYRARKEYEVARNEAGENADAAAATLLEKRITDPKTKACYEAGKLPDGRIDLRARRIAVKLLLSHLHDVMTWHRHGRRAPEPYAIAILGHAHKIECPNPPWD